MSRYRVFERELSEAIRVAQEAGNILLSQYGNPEGVEKKEDGSLVSRADRASSEHITDELRRLFPEHAILNEEQRDDGSRFERPLCWVVDPLDGTKEYLNKIGHFGVMIGLTERAEPVLGVTFKPLRNELAYAAVGQGAFLRDASGEHRLHVSGSETIHALVSRSRQTQELTDLLEAIQPAEISRMGGSLKTVEVARGNVNLFLCPPSSTMHLWDLCAPSVILHEAGGLLTDVRGEPIDYARPDTANSNGVIAASSAIHKTVISKLAPMLA